MGHMWSLPSWDVQRDKESSKQVRNREREGGIYSKELYLVKMITSVCVCVDLLYIDGQVRYVADP